MMEPLRNTIHAEIHSGTAVEFETWRGEGAPCSLESWKFLNLIFAPLLDYIRLLTSPCRPLNTFIEFGIGIENVIATILHCQVYFIIPSAHMYRCFQIGE